MSELNFTKLADAPVLDEVPDGAKVYAEVDGKVYRVAGDNLGGGIPAAVITVGDGEYKCGTMTYEEARACLEAQKAILFMKYADGKPSYLENVELSDSFIKITLNDLESLYWESSGIEYQLLIP